MMMVSNLRAPRPLWCRVGLHRWGPWKHASGGWTDDDERGLEYRQPYKYKMCRRAYCPAVKGRK